MKAEIRTPDRPGEPDKVESIPLPPEEMWAELDNSGAGGSAKPAGVKATPAPAVETLDFIDGVPATVVPLNHAFRRAGAEVREIRVSRLTVAAVGALLDSLPADRRDNFDIYAAMTGLPAAVLRGLIDDDGERVAEACFDFLPRVFRPVAAEAASSST